MIRNWKCLTLLLCSLLPCGAIISHAQSGKSAPDFIIDTSKPYVYLKFDHVGKRQPLSRHEPDRGLWIRLVNNCRLPVTVGTFGTETSDPGVAPYDEIVAVDLFAPPLARSAPSGEKIAEIEKSEEPTPKGYSPGEIVNTTTIEPGSDLLLSLPANHVGPNWKLEIRFYLKVPRQNFYGDGPYSVVSFGWPDVPKEFRDAVGQ